MIHKLFDWWLRTMHTSLTNSKNSAPPDWTVRAASYTNLGLSLILSGIVMKIGLRIFGLGNPWFLVYVALTCLPLVYMMIENKIGLSPKRILRSHQPFYGKFSSAKRNLSMFIVLLYAPICFLIMIVLMKIL